MSGPTLVVGAGQAGVQLAVSLRERGDRAPITLVGGEEWAPYQRPPLSKQVLAGTARLDSLALRTDAFYREHGIDVVRGESVVDLSLAAGGPPGSGTAATDRGRTLRFDRLALTVGSRPCRLDVPGSELDGVTYLRDIADARRLKTSLETARDVVVVGGGFIGLEVAAAARATAGRVTVVEFADRLIARAVAPMVSAFYRDAHARRGTEVRLGTGVTEIVGDGGRASGVRLTDGEQLPADLVVIGIGVAPRTELAEQLDLHCTGGGVVVDECARTSAPGVVAAGDCTVQPHPSAPGLVRLESVPNAINQARVAAGTLLGAPAASTDAPWFWSDQYDLKLQMAGVADGYDALVVRGDPGTERFSVLYYRGTDLLAVHAVNTPVDYLAARRALTMRTPIPPELAADETAPLKALLAGAAAR